MRRWLVAALLCGLAVGVLAIPPGMLTTGGFRYLFRDQFTTDDAAPITSPRTCEPGPGTWTVVDTENKISTASGALTFAGGKAAAVYGNPAMYSTATIARASGMALIGTLDALGASEVAEFGWDSNQTTGIQEGVRSVSTSSINVQSAAFKAANLAISYPATIYVIQRAPAGSWIAWSTATEAAKLRWVNSTDTTADMYVAINSNNAAYTADNVRVVRLPAFASDALVYTAYTASPANPATSTMTADAVVEVTWTAGAGETFELSVRRTDDNNRWIHRCDQAGSTMKIMEVAGGIETERASSSQTWTAGTAYRIVVIADGQVLRQWAGSTLRNTYSSAATNETATGVKVAGHAAAAELYSWPRLLNIPGGV